MSHVLSSAQMKAIDKRTIDEFGLPARILMETAGNACADYLLSNYPEIKKGIVFILHGGGNNSGDGFVIARRLFLAGVEVHLLKVHSSPLTAESKINYQLCEKLGIRMLDFADQSDLMYFTAMLPKIPMIIDALFGVGFRGKLSEAVTDIFALVNLHFATRIAIDIPSGVNADTGVSEIDTFIAHQTLCIHCPKFGNLLREGRFYSGKLTNISIGIPSMYHDDIPRQVLTDEANCKYPDRYPDTHKGSYGRVYVIGGSPGYSGSVALTSKAVLRSGAGFCMLMSRQEMEPAYYNLSPEVMFRPIMQDEATNLPTESGIKDYLAKATSIVIGCGMGLDAYALKLLQFVLQHSEVPTVVDADAIHLIAENKSLWEYLKKPNIMLTPHLGEFAFLTQQPVSVIEADVIGALSAFCKRTNAKVLLKGFTTIFHDGEILLFNTAGNDGLATGGSGDVLAGIIASFAAQGLELPTAAINASYLMGKTAEKLAEKRGTASILPSDIIDHLFVK